MSRAFFEGEFEVVSHKLESFLKTHGSEVSRSEIKFVYKYLSVVYAADPNTKVKAESYMYLFTHRNLFR